MEANKKKRRNISLFGCEILFKLASARWPEQDCSHASQAPNQAPNQAGWEGICWSSIPAARLRLQDPKGRLDDKRRGVES